MLLSSQAVRSELPPHWTAKRIHGSPFLAAPSHPSAGMGSPVPRSGHQPSLPTATVCSPAGKQSESLCGALRWAAAALSIPPLFPQRQPKGSQRQTAAETLLGGHPGKRLQPHDGQHAEEELRGVAANQAGEEERVSAAELRAASCRQPGEGCRRRQSPGGFSRLAALSLSRELLFFSCFDTFSPKPLAVFLLAHRSSAAPCPRSSPGCLWMSWKGAGGGGKAAFGHPLVASRAAMVPFRPSSNVVEPYKREAEPQAAAASGQRLDLGTQEAKEFFAWLLKAKKNQR